MLQRDKLEAMKVEELRDICKEKGISCYKNSKRMNKTELIEALMAGSKTKSAEKKEAKKSDEKLNKKAAKKSDEKVKQAEPVVDAEEEAARLERKQKYIEQAVVGTLIAFKLPNDKVISAMIVKKSTKNRKFKVETKYGAEFIVMYDDVLWVKTNKRWPKGIYQLFKKNLEEGANEDGREEDVSETAC